MLQNAAKLPMISPRGLGDACGHFKQSRACYGLASAYVQFYRPDTGKWEKVVVDNAVPVRPIPTSANKRPVKTNSNDGKKLPPPKPKPKYASSREPEMWVMLIEKAYAKWVSSRAKNEKFDTENPYDNINFGLIDEALVSFTGGVKSLIPLDTTEGQAEARSGKLWDHLVDYHYFILVSVFSFHLKSKATNISTEFSQTSNLFNFK